MKIGPVRQCVGCGQMKEKKDLIRIVRTPEDTFEFDPTGKKNGRGAYICNKKECLEKSYNKHTLDRSFKKPVPKDVYETLLKEFESTNG